jgi:hypothetical protein
VCVCVCVGGGGLVGTSVVLWLLLETKMETDYSVVVNGNSLFGFGCHRYTFFLCFSYHRNESFVSEFF